MTQFTPSDHVQVADPASPWFNRNGTITEINPRCTYGIQVAGIENIPLLFTPHELTHQPTGKP